eukprot:3118423-Prorocentrum_lima.AAC.1
MPDGEASEMRQRLVLLEQQQIQAMDASQQLMYQCQVYQSCGMQRALENRQLAEQNLPAKALIESISGHVRDQQRSQEHHLR